MIIITSALVLFARQDRKERAIIENKIPQTASGLRIILQISFQLLRYELNC